MITNRSHKRPALFRQVYSHRRNIHWRSAAYDWHPISPMERTFLQVSAERNRAESFQLQAIQSHCLDNKFLKINENFNCQNTIFNSPTISSSVPICMFLWLRQWLGQHELFALCGLLGHKNSELFADTAQSRVVLSVCTRWVTFFTGAGAFMLALLLSLQLLAVKYRKKTVIFKVCNNHKKNENYSNSLLNQVV